MQADFWTQNWASFLDPELGPFCGHKLVAIFWTKKLGHFFFQVFRFLLFGVAVLAGLFRGRQRLFPSSMSHLKFSSVTDCFATGKPRGPKR